MALLTLTLKHVCSGGRGWLLRLLLVLSVFAGARGGFAEDAPPEDQVKAAFLVNFPKYVDWPTENFAETNSPIIVATLGETGLGDHVRKMIAGRTVNGRPLVFKVIAESEVARDFHILFIPDSVRRRLPAILEKLKDSQVLTVGETDDFLSRGGVINLTRRDQKVRLEVNLVAARQAGLKISSKLLSVADVVKGK